MKTNTERTKPPTKRTLYTLAQRQRIIAQGKRDSHSNMFARIGHGNGGPATNSPPNQGSFSPVRSLGPITMPMGEFTLRPNQDGINKTLQGPVRMPRRNSSKFTLSRNQGNIEKTSIAKPVRNSCKFTLSRNQGGIDKTVQADRMHNRGNMLEVVKHDNRNNALEVVKQDNRSNVLAVVKHEERIENMARRRNFLGNKKKAEIDRIQFLKQQEPDCMPGT